MVTVLAAIFIFLVDVFEVLFMLLLLLLFLLSLLMSLLLMMSLVLVLVLVSMFMFMFMLLVKELVALKVISESESSVVDRMGVSRKVSKPSDVEAKVTEEEARGHPRDRGAIAPCARRKCSTLFE